MRTDNELRELSEIFFYENDKPFLPVDEIDIEPDADLGFLDKVRRPRNEGGAEPVERERECAAPTAPAAMEENGEAPASNTGLVKYREGEFPPGWGGYDGGCEASYYGLWGAGFTQLCERLDEAKQAADDGREAAAYVELGGFVWLVRPMGAGCGPFKYKYVLESHGVKLYIHSNPKPGIPGIHVRFGFECLVKTWLFDAVATLERCIRSAGFHITEHKISRVDMQILLPVPVGDFVQAMQGARVITRCRGTYHLLANMKTGNIETIMISSENCELCIYDKRAQIEKSDLANYLTFCRHVLGSDEAQLPPVLTRVEFRFKRPYLKRYGIDTFDDLQNSAAALLQIASSDWFRILSRDKVRGSENEIPDAPIWARVREAFAYYFAENSPTTRTPAALRANRPAPTHPVVSRLVKQALGCLASAASVCLESVAKPSQVLAYAESVIQSGINSMFFRVAQKQILNGVTRGFSVGKSFECTINDILELCPETKQGEWAF